MKIAVTGASGHLGRLVIEKLKQKISSDDVVGLVRSLEKAKDLGVEVRIADYTQPASLDTALAGVDTLLLISGNEIGQRAAQHANVIKAAKKAGVKRIVYTSLLHADRSPLSLAPEHLQTEADLKASGVQYTILRNGWYTENYTVSIAPALANGAFYGSADDGKIASAARVDYAEAAVVAVTNEAYAGMTYELAGDEAYTLAELAAEISKQTGTSIPYKNIPEAAYADALKSAGLPEEFAAGLASWDIGASQGALFDDGDQLSKLIGRATTPMADTVKQALA